jgi:Coenzyme PQQ synthesis protein D (PqqD)
MALLLKIADGVRSTHERDGAVVLDIHHGQMFTLNIVGSKILGMMERGCPETKIVDDISREFGIRPDIVERDVREFLECLEKHRLVESRPRSSGA